MTGTGSGDTLTVATTTTTTMRRSRRFHRVSVDSIDHKKTNTMDSSPTRTITRTSTASLAAVASPNDPEPSDHDDDPTKEEIAVYPFNGVNYTCYQDMVHAKRQRNQQMLEQSGLLSSSSLYAPPRRVTTTVGIGPSRRRSSVNDDTTQKKRRQSSRLQGLESDGRYIEEERAGQVIVANPNDNDDETDHRKKSKATVDQSSSSRDEHRNRIRDGTPLSLSEAVEETGAKWMTETGISDATTFVQKVLQPFSHVPPPREEDPYDPSFVHELTCSEQQVAKLCPDRIYSMAFHPSTSMTVVSAGDKSGHIGIWHVQDDVDVDDQNSSQPTPPPPNGGVHLFKPHIGAVCALQWTGGTTSTTTGTNLISASYDGKIRMLDVAHEQFTAVFCTYNDDPTHQHQPGFGIEQHYGNKSFWTQHVALDPRYNEASCFFIATSTGAAMHLDLRSKNPVTFHEQFSEKKINTLSLHPNGYSLISGGLDTTVALWDVRTLGNDLRSKRSKPPTPLAYYNCGRSVNSVFFSPSGKYAVSTTMANKLDIFEDLHLGVVDQNQKPSKSKNDHNLIHPKKSIPHDNMTGRWLSTFQAIFHPQLDLFVVGSMRQPRCIELFDPSDGRLIRSVQGEGITAVQSRLAVHPRTDQWMIGGGNSSGRVSMVRKSK